MCRGHRSPAILWARASPATAWATRRTWSSTGVDARVHYVELNATLVPDEARIGAILTVGREPSARSVDKTIAAIAARNDRFYDPRQHFEIARMTARIPGGDVEGHVEAHVRRLEALRRAGIVNRVDADHWDIPKNFLERATAYDDHEARKLVVEVHSAVALEKQITAEAATWLDRQLVGRHRVETAPMGFGHKVESALLLRNEYLIAQRLAYRVEDGSCATSLTCWPRSSAVSWSASASALRPSAPMAWPMSRRATAHSFRGTYRRAIMLTSGKVAVIENERQFTLVPWRAILERHRGREVVGIVRGMGVSWQLGMQRDRGLSR